MYTSLATIAKPGLRKHLIACKFIIQGIFGLCCKRRRDDCTSTSWYL